MEREGFSRAKGTMTTTLAPPSIEDVHRARQRLSGLLRPTPLMPHPLLNEALGLDVYVKHENHNPTGAFKVRGGLNLLATLVEQGAVEHVITASTGNHGQSIALACRRYRVPCTIVVPEGNNPEKNAAMRAFGAEVVEHGRDFDIARQEVERRIAQAGGRLRYVHSANEPLLIAGVATYALEIFEDLPDADVVFVPIGGGSGASGLVTVRDALRSCARIVGVQAERADAFARSWRGPDRVIGERADTFAEGLATRVTFDLTVRHPPPRPGGRDHAVRGGARRRGAARAPRHAQSRGGRRGRHAGRGAAMAGSARGTQSRVRDERRQPRSGHAPPHRGVTLSVRLALRDGLDHNGPVGPNDRLGLD